MKKYLQLIFILLISIIIFVSCRPNIDELIISGSNEILVGEKTLLNIVLNSDDNSNPQINWTSSNNDIATVNNGKVEGLAKGEVTITASLENNPKIKDEFIIYVKELSTPLIHNVTFVISELNIIKISDGEKVVKPEDPFKEGFAFVGWFTDEECTSEYDFDLVVNSDLTLYAKFKIETIETEEYIISFNNTNLDSIKVNKGEKITKPIDPYKEGYIFQGWYTDEYYTNLYNFDREIYENIILYAKFELETIETEEYIISFNNTNLDSIKVNKGEKITKPIDPYKEGYIFQGWYIDDKYSIIFDFEQPINSNIQLYAKFIKLVEPESIIVTGRNVLTIGFSTKLSVEIQPFNSIHTIVWEVHSSSKNLGEIDAEGNVIAKKEGKFIVRAISSVNPKIKSSYFEIKFINNSCSEYPDLKGYKFVIVASDNDLSNVDPSSSSYVNTDKLYKLNAIDKIQELYNCKITYKSYSDMNNLNENEFINNIVQNAKNNLSEFDILYTDSSKLNYLIKKDVVNTVTDIDCFYPFTPIIPMSQYYKKAITYNDELYGLGYPSEIYQTHIYNGLFYDYEWVKKLDVESPAKLFNEGNWTYSNFKKWVIDVQSKLNQNEYVLGGHPYNYLIQLVNSTETPILDLETKEVNLMSSRAIYASNLINDLANYGAFNKNITFDKNVNIECSHSNDGNKTLMIANNLDFNNINYNEYKSFVSKLWNDNTKEIGFVPYPYPDDMNKNDIKASISFVNIYSFLKGRNYPSSFGLNGQKYAIIIMNEILTETSSLYNTNIMGETENILLNMYLKDIDSIAAANYYDESKVIYNPVHMIYDNIDSSSEECPLFKTSIDVILYNKDFNIEFGNLIDKYKEKFNSWIN